MAENDTRLAVVEMQLKQHDRMHEETQSSMRILSDGISKLVQAEVRREQDDETFQRLFKEIDELRVVFQNYKDIQAEKELAAYKGIVLRIAGLSALIIASVLAGHFGTRLLG